MREEEQQAEQARAGGRARKLMAVLAELEEAVAAGRPADAAMTRLLRDHPEFGSRDRRLYSETVFACFRWRGWIGPASEAGPAVPALAGLLDQADPGAPLPPALAYLAAEAGFDPTRWPAPPPGTLEEKAAALAALTGRPAPALEALAPAWFAELAAGPDALGAERMPRLLASFQQRPPLWLRAVGADGEALRRALEARGLAVRPHPALPRALRLDTHPHLAELEKAIGARFDVQDLASQAVTALCSPQPGARWLDLCAGGGGKTLALAEAVGPSGAVRAVDIRPRALRELERRAQRLGLRNVTTAEGDGAAFEARGEAFDGVLVDAPCSGVGTWSRNPDARWRTPRETVFERAALQQRLLDRAARAVRPGGRLVYSVCTLTRPETTDVAEAFLRGHAEFEAEATASPLHAGPAAAFHWVMPWEGPCGGMFIARFRRRP